MFDAERDRGSTSLSRAHVCLPRPRVAGKARVILALLSPKVLLLLFYLPHSIPTKYIHPRSRRGAPASRAERIVTECGSATANIGKETAERAQRRVREDERRESALVISVDRAILRDFEGHLTASIAPIARRVRTMQCAWTRFITIHSRHSRSRPAIEANRRATCLTFCRYDQLPRETHSTLVPEQIPPLLSCAMSKRDRNGNNKRLRLAFLAASQPPWCLACCKTHSTTDKVCISKHSLQSISCERQKVAA